LRLKVNNTARKRACSSALRARVVHFYNMLQSSFFLCAVSVAVIRRSRSRACVLVLLPHLSSTTYLSCIIDTLCKQILRLALSEVGTSRTRPTRKYIILCFLLHFPHCNSFSISNASSSYYYHYYYRSNRPIHILCYPIPGRDWHSALSQGANSTLP
jgi:hypothetical protein